jgi:hypothetical protein
MVGSDIGMVSRDVGFDGSPWASATEGNPTRIRSGAIRLGTESSMRMFLK